MTISHSPAETFELGRAHAASLQPGDVLALCGDLGAGKTQFVKGLASGLGASGDVTSPTFTLIHEYRGGRLPLFHADLYRLESAEEVMGIGLDEYFAGRGVTVVEWADKFPELMPPRTQWRRLRIGEGDLREILDR